MTNLETIGYHIHTNIDDLSTPLSHIDGFCVVYNHWFFNGFFILLFLAWSIFLKTVFMDLGGVGNNRVSYLLNYQCFPDFFHILRGFVPYIKWDALYILDNTRFLSEFHQILWTHCTYNVQAYNGWRLINLSHTNYISRRNTSFLSWLRSLIICIMDGSTR